MGLDGQISYKLLVGGIFAVLIFSLFGAQQAMAGNGADINIDKCLTSDGTGVTCKTAEGSVGSILRAEGQTGFFRIDAINEGSSISNVVVLDKLPNELQFVSSNAGTFPHGNSYNPSTGVWDVGTISEGSTSTLLIEFIVKSRTCGSEILNTASLTSGDSSSTNDVASATVLLVDNFLNEDVIALQKSGSTLEDFKELDCPSTTSGGGTADPPTIGMNARGSEQMVINGICIDVDDCWEVNCDDNDGCWTVTQNFHEDFDLVTLLTGVHTISNTIYCSKGVDTCNHITLSSSPYGTDINSAIWKVSVDKNFLGEITVTKDDPDGYLGVATCTAQIVGEQYWATSCTIDFKLGTPGMMLGVQLWDTYRSDRNFYFNHGIEIIDTYGYPHVDTEYESTLDVPRLCLADNPDKRTSCTFAEKIQLEIERAEKLLS